MQSWNWRLTQNPLQINKNNKIWARLIISSLQRLNFDTFNTYLESLHCPPGKLDFYCAHVKSLLTQLALSKLQCYHQSFFCPRYLLTHLSNSCHIVSDPGIKTSTLQACFLSLEGNSSSKMTLKKWNRYFCHDIKTKLVIQSS